MPLGDDPVDRARGSSRYLADTGREMALRARQSRLDP